MLFLYSISSIVVANQVEFSIIYFVINLIHLIYILIWNIALYVFLVQKFKLCYNVHFTQHINYLKCDWNEYNSTNLFLVVESIFKFILKFLFVLYNEICVECIQGYSNSRITIVISETVRATKKFKWWQSCAFASGLRWWTNCSGKRWWSSSIELKLKLCS